MLTDSFLNLLSKVYVKFHTRLSITYIRSQFLKAGMIEPPFHVGPYAQVQNLAATRSLRIHQGCTINGWIDLLPKGQLEIGAYTYIGTHTRVICSGKTEIGSGCWIADNVLIFDGNHHSISAQRRLADAYNFGINQIFPDTYSEGCEHSFVKIGNSVWIGGQSVIVRGVTIGDGVIIGAGAVVTQNIPAWSLAVGSPARVVRKLKEEELLLPHSEVAQPILGISSSK